MTNGLTSVPSLLWLVTKPGRSTPNGWLGDVYTDRQEALRMAMRGEGDVVVELKLDTSAVEPKGFIEVNLYPEPQK